MRDEANAPVRKAGPLKRFFAKRPAVGIAGSIASVVGVLLAVYFYVEGRQSRELTYYVHPAKAAVVRMGQTSRLSLTLDEKPLSTDVTAAQLAFWNAGELPIRGENVLKSMKVITSPDSPIIEAIIRKRSRDVIEIELDETRLEKGELGVSWNILEKNDGGIIQVVYAGSADVPIRVSAIVEGQPAIRMLEFSERVRSPSEQYEWLSYQKRRSAYWFLAVGVVMIVFMGLTAVVRMRVRHRKLTKFESFLFLTPLVFILVAGIELIRSSPPGPPFGF